MNAPLYNADILRLAATIPHAGRLTDPQATSEKYSPVCGSRVTVDLALDDAGRVVRLGLVVNACALGQAAANLMASHAIGRDAAALAVARDALGAWLAGERAAPPDWPGMAVLAPARPHSARHASIRLAFEAAAEAARLAAKAD
ncbi:iron-sulfur cluster assembly scaffold protein [Sphingomonas flavalba]|uniref:iron-sulfur cluster assembly scaffold protein n=1 Tax=Sphingomonas flavalba TaxID=2559804 RepID=UPI00109DFEBD|nr:iron-sulfur cluster assembly scaffold protein [Sphingomonas flavalba]